MTVDAVPAKSVSQRKLSPQDAFRVKWREAAGNPQSTLVNPYPGLRSFNVDEAHIFRARVNQIRALCKAFAGSMPADAARHVIMVVGGSSSGKSSIVKAGLLAEIHSLQMPGEGGNWYVAECRPVQAPMQELLHGLATMMVDAIFNELKGVSADLATKVDEALDAMDAPDLIDAPAVGGDIRSNAVRRVRALLDSRLWSVRHTGEPASMAPALTLFARETLDALDRHLHRFRAGPPRLLISIDQFEEIFRCADGPERDAVFGLIRFADQAEAQNAPELYVVASMRSEELHRCSEFKGVADILNRSMHLVELVLREDAKLAIVEPGRFTLQGYGFPFEEDPNWPFTKDAVLAIADAYEFSSSTIEHRADALSLLQHFLRLLWERTVSKWVAGDTGTAGPLIDLACLSAIRGWDAPVSSRPASVPAFASKAGEAQHRLASVLNYRADTVYQAAIKAWCAAAGDSSEATKALARSVLKAAFVSLARRDDQRRVVRDWQTISGMLAASGEAEKFAQSSATGAKSAADAAALLGGRFETPLAAALREFERATLIERRADAAADGRPSSDKYTVYHEAFIRNWTQYADWVREAGKAADTLRGIYDELSLIGQGPSTPDGRKPEDIITAGNEADLSAVIGGTDESVGTAELTATDGTIEGDATKIQRGWASRAWAASEIARAAKSGEPLDVSNVLAKIRDARRGAIIARASRFELEARALKARLRATNLLRWTTGACVALVATISLLYFVYQQNEVNWFRSQISAIGLISFEATEIIGGINRHINQDRDLWLALNALDPTAANWPSDKTLVDAREKMRVKIGQRVRQALADLTYAPDKKAFFDKNPLFGGDTVSGQDVTCLRRGDKVTIEGDAKVAPAVIRYQITNDGTLEYATGRLENPRMVNNVQPGLEATTVVCVAPDATALLVVTKRSGQPWIFVVLTQWNRATLKSGEAQWFLQTYPGREILSYSSGALLAGNPIYETGKFAFFRQGPVIGFLVPNQPSNDPSKPPRARVNSRRVGVLWTNEGFSSPALRPKDLTADKPRTLTCTPGERGSQFCRLEVLSAKGETIAAFYVMFDGQSKACVPDAEYCQVAVKVSKGDEELIEFSYQGRPPKNFAMDDEYLWIQGDDDIVRSFDRRLQTATTLLALRWKHLSCKLGSYVLGNVAVTKGVPLLNAPKGLPEFLDGRDCGNTAVGE